MKNILLENEYIRSSYITEKGYVLNYWKDDVILTEEAFKTAMIIIADKMRTYDAKGILIDTRFFNLTISIALQNWYNENIVPKHLEANIIKMAFLLPEEFFAKMSIEQTMDEEAAQAQETRYFDSYEEAEDWLVAS